MHNFFIIHFLLIKRFIYICFFLLFIFKIINYNNNVDFKDPPDQYAHLSYIEYIKNNPFRFIPEFEKMKINHSPLNDNNHMNYLSHPPLYYYIMSLVNNNRSVSKYITNLQILNIVISIASYLLLLYIGYKMNINVLAHLGYLSLVNAIPMIPYIGASINNDNLSIFSGMVFIIGILKIIDNPLSRLSYLLISIGFFLGYFSKLTVFLLMFFTLIFIVYYFIINKISFKKNTLLIVTLTCIIFIPILFYQIEVMAKYHSIYPSLSARSIEEYANSRFYVEESKRVFLNIFQWFQRLIAYWQVGWFGIMSEKLFLNINIGSFILHFFVIFTLYYKCKKNEHYCIVAKFAYISILLIIAIQFYFSYKSHLNTGYLGGLQSRYYLPFVSIFAILSSLFINKIKSIVFQILILFICFYTTYYDLLFTKIVLEYYKN